jgi:hypothetical protein
MNCVLIPKLTGCALNPRAEEENQISPRQVKLRRESKQGRYVYGIHNLMTSTTQQNENAVYEMRIMKCRWSMLT